MTVLDCHIHAWRYPDHFDRAVMMRGQLTRRHDWPEEKFRAMWDLPIERYLEERDPRVGHALLLGIHASTTLGIHVDNAYLQDAAARHPDRVSWACCVTPPDPDAAQEIERCVVDGGAVAVGELGPAYGGYRMDAPECFPAYEAAAALGVPILVHAGPVQAREAHLRDGDLLALDEVAIAFPDLRIVLCHLGYPRYEEAAFLLGKHENVYADISWLAQIGGLDRRILPAQLPVVTEPFHHFAYPIAYYFSQTFGNPHKLLWGTDFPAAGTSTSLDALLDVNAVLRRVGLAEIPDQAIHTMLHDTWRQVFTRIAANAP